MSEAYADLVPSAAGARGLWKGEAFADLAPSMNVRGTP